MYIKSYYVYLMTNKTNNVIYTGVTNNLIRRVNEHKHNRTSSFTWKYNVRKLVYFEVFDNIVLAIKREKQIKAGSRIRKVNLIKGVNPHFEDLYTKIR